MSKTYLLITGTGMASVYNEAVKIQDTIRRLGHHIDMVFFNKTLPSRTPLPHYDVAVWWTPFLPMFIYPQKLWLTPKKCYVAVCYYTIEGTVYGVKQYKDWLGWQHIATVSNFVKSNLNDMNVNVKEVIPHQIDPTLPVDDVYGAKWRAKFPSDKKVLLYNGSQIARKGLPKLREAINLLSQKRSDFVMVFHTDNVKIPYHTPVSQLQGVNTVVECEFPHIPLSYAYAKMKYADIIVHPAITEGFGLPVLEALNLGKPLVCVNAYGVNEIANPMNSFMVMNTHNTVLKWTGYITFKVSEYNAKDLADMINLALNAGKEELESKRILGLETARRFYHAYERFAEFNP